MKYLIIVVAMVQFASLGCSKNAKAQVQTEPKKEECPGGVCKVPSEGCKCEHECKCVHSKLGPVVWTIGTLCPLGKLSGGYGRNPQGQIVSSCYEFIPGHKE